MMDMPPEEEFSPVYDDEPEQPEPDQPRDAFPCAVGSEVPAMVLWAPGRSTDRHRCPACRHLATNHDADTGGTCDICNAARIIVNSLVAAIRSGEIRKEE